MLNKVFHKSSKSGTTAASTPATAATPASKPTESLNREHATAGTASVSKSDELVETVKARRTIYALGKDKILSDKEIISLVQSAVREAPSAFNSQTSRILILLGSEHDTYWSDVVLPELGKVMDAESLERQKGRIAGFKSGYGTVLFFEDEAVITQFQQNIPAFASMFGTWSAHGSGMAQIYVWNVLEAAGYGANLQHLGSVAQSALHQKYSLPPTWKSHAELVFGSVKAPAKEKTYINDADRFKIFGAAQ